MGVFRALVQHADLDKNLEGELFAALQSKDSTALQELVRPLDEVSRHALLVLPTLYGSCDDVLARARKLLPDFPGVAAALDDLHAVSNKLQHLVSGVGIDLADLRGYHYHSGIVFAAYHEGSCDAIALGGRYDDLGKSFGRARAATGFSMDLRQLYRLLPAQPQQFAIRAPYLEDAALHAEIARLRAAGEVVVVSLPGSTDCPVELQCNRDLVLREGVWQLICL